MARWTKKLIAKQLAWSNECYCKALVRCYHDRLSGDERNNSIRWIVKTLRKRLGKEPNSPEVSAAYLKNLCQLDTKKIELIVEAYNKKKQYRSPSTIDVLLSELFERAMNTKKRKK